VDPAAKGPSDPLSAEERIRRATVPPPGKDCAPDPKEQENARLDALRERNLDFASASDWTIKRASEIAGREWASQRTRLDVASKADWKQHWESWLGDSGGRDAARSLRDPCKNASGSGDRLNLTRSPADGTSPSRQQNEHLGLSVDGSRDRPPASLAQGLLMAVVVGPFSRETSQGQRDACPDGSDACGGGPEQPSELLSFMAGLSEREASTDECAEDGNWRRTGQLFAVVRGELIGGQEGAAVLLASASNVPVACSVEVRIERDGAEITRRAIAFEGAGRQGGIAKETALGYGPDPYGDQFSLSSACVPRVVWGGGDVIGLAQE